VTPGHLRRPAPAGRPATFAVLDAGARDLELTVFSDEAAQLRQEKVTLGRTTTRLSVK
jgi:hypothetical protein